MSIKVPHPWDRAVLQPRPVKPVGLPEPLVRSGLGTSPTSVGSTPEPKVYQLKVLQDPASVLSPPNDFRQLGEIGPLKTGLEFSSRTLRAFRHQAPAPVAVLLGALLEPASACLNHTSPPPLIRY